jgi:hypothetical protein
MSDGSQSRRRRWLRQHFVSLPAGANCLLYHTGCDQLLPFRWIGRAAAKCLIQLGSITVAHVCLAILPLSIPPSLEMRRWAGMRLLLLVHLSTGREAVGTVWRQPADACCTFLNARQSKPERRLGVSWRFLAVGFAFSGLAPGPSLRPSSPPSSNENRLARLSRLEVEGPVIRHTQGEERLAGRPRR